ncbi:MAG: DUF6088 family protein [Akkermansia sp.]|nr:DUF6088 family protein [Akkermansia sp.]
MALPKGERSLEQKILARLVRNGKGYVFSNHDFLDLGKDTSVAWSLMQLKRRGTIRQLLRGLYDYPRYSQRLGETVAPDLYKAAQALARKFAWTIQPSGGAALNALGLSTQVPMRLVFLSNGPSRTYRFGKRDLRFVHVATRKSQFSSPQSGLVIQALMELGKDHITRDAISQIARAITPATRKALAKDLVHTPEWCRNAIRQIITEHDHE